jgi:hypothetical protein
MKPSLLLPAAALVLLSEPLSFFFLGPSPERGRRANRRRCVPRRGAREADAGE